MIAVTVESKVASIIIRRARRHFELLAFRIKGLSHPFYRLPGGGIHAGEAVREALYRETAEETGIPKTDLVYWRQAGILQYFKPITHKAVTRYDYLLLYSGSVPDRFDWQVTGDDGDAGHVFQYRWISPGDVDRIDPEQRRLVNPYNLPEFFTRPDDLGLARGIVRLRPQCAQWQRIYELEEMEIRNSTKADIEVHHVGSTAIPGLRAKPIVDILIGHGGRADAEHFIRDMTEIGYAFHGENGIAGRQYFTKGTREVTYVHVHAFARADGNYANHLHTRDVLRENERLRRKYDAYKTHNINRSRNDYTDGKAELMAEIARTGRGS